MNAARRKQLEAIKTRIEDLAQDLVSLEDEEQECFDNLPESLQQSERGVAMEAAAGALSEAQDYLSNAVDYIDEASV
jgi:hypothetical protein